MAGFDRGALSAKRRGVEPLMATATKHYMRKCVWLEVAKQRSERVGGPIHYFTLTTADLFDVRLFEREGLLERTARGYPGLGFCEFSDKEYDDIMRKVGWCRWSYKGWFEEMVRDHPNFDSDFSFDVVNLDFILVPFPEQDSPLEGTWGAIQRLLEIQWNHQRSFDLFLTFNGSRDGTDPDAIARVANLLASNLQTGRGATELEGRIGHRDVRRLLEDDYVEFLCVGLPKLVVGDALQLGFDLTRADIYKYPRLGDGQIYYIVKFAFSFEVPDNTQRSFADPPRLVENYDAAVPLIFSTPAKDVGDLLDSDPVLRKEVSDDLDSLRGELA